MRKPLTDRQQEIYNFIVQEIRDRGIPPTIREIGDRFGMRSSNGAREALNAIARKGYIRRHDRMSRGIEIVDMVWPSSRAPVGTQVPLLTEWDTAVGDVPESAVDGYVLVDSSMVPDGSAFAVRVYDDGLQPSGVHQGDMAVAVARQPASDESFVVASVSSRLVVRKYRVADDRREVLTDPSMGRPEEIYVVGDEVRVVGEVCALMRQMSVGGA